MFEKILKIYPLHTLNSNIEIHKLDDTKDSDNTNTHFKF